MNTDRLLQALRTRTRLLIGIALGMIIAGCIVATQLGLTRAADWADSVAQAARASGPKGLFLFALAQTGVALVGIVPASMLGFAAGVVFGIGLGFAVAASGTLLGGLLAFWLARSLLRPWIARMLAARPAGRLVGLDEAVQRDGWRLVCLLRVSPIMPFAITSYALGLTNVRMTDYALGTLAALPALLGYVTLGMVASAGLQSVAETSASGGGLRWVLLAVGAVATLALIVRSGALLSACGLLPAQTLSKRALRRFRSSHTRC
jgi:uncharacterized membrane protein YdjX (TVP38/TMEM64 family)